MFEAERASLVPYRGPFDGFHALPASVSKTCLVRFDNNKYSVLSSDIVLNILARRRDPDPAVTITTPDALRLSCEPIADCARYDSLRKAM